MKFYFDKIFSLSYMGKICHLLYFLLLLWYKDSFIDSYCLLQIDYASFPLSLSWVESVLYINCQSTWSVGTLYSLQYPYGYRHGYGVWICMVCEDTPHSVISIWKQIWLHVHLLSLLHSLDIKIDLFKIHIIYHNSKILNIKSFNFEIISFSMV